METKDIKTIDVNAYEWFDKVNGNSYFAGIVTLNFGMNNSLTFKMPFQYGYGNQNEYEALETIRRNGFFTDDKDITALWHLRDKYGIILRTNKYKNCKKRDLVNL